MIEKSSGQRIHERGVVLGFSHVIVLPRLKLPDLDVVQAKCAGGTITQRKALEPTSRAECSEFADPLSPVHLATPLGCLAVLNSTLTTNDEVLKTGLFPRHPIPVVDDDDLACLCPRLTEGDGHPDTVRISIPGVGNQLGHSCCRAGIELRTKLLHQRTDKFQLEIRALGGGSYRRV